MRKLLCLIFPLVFMAAVLCTGFTTKGEQTINWGLVHNNNEKTPTPPAGSRELLQQYNGIFVADETKKQVYLTFDLGYEAGHTVAVLDILKQNNIHAIFFLCGNYMQHTDIIDRMLADGHAIGNHTNHHRDLPTLPDEGIKNDIAELTQLLCEKYPDKQPPKYFRPPKGRISARVLREAAAQNMKTVMWSSAIADWSKSPIDAAACADKITGRIHPGAIILLHITNSGTPKMLNLLIPQLMQKGYTFGDAGTL